MEYSLKPVRSSYVASQDVYLLYEFISDYRNRIKLHSVPSHFDIASIGRRAQVSFLWVYPMYLGVCPQAHLWACPLYLQAYLRAQLADNYRGKHLTLLGSPVSNSKCVIHHPMVDSFPCLMSFRQNILFDTRRRSLRSLRRAEATASRTWRE